MTKLTREQVLQSKELKEVFDAHKDSNEIHVTSGGEFFLASAKNYAQDHARKNGEEVFTIKRDELPAGKKAAKTESSKNDEDKAPKKDEGKEPKIEGSARITGSYADHKFGMLITEAKARGLDVSKIKPTHGAAAVVKVLEADDLAKAEGSK